MFSFVFIYIAFAALLTVVSANSVQVNNLDFHQPYELCWVPNAGQPAIHTPVLEPRTSQYVRLPYSWAGAIHAIYSGGGEAACDRHAVIAELTFQGFEGKTWYDVSAVDNLNDNTAVHYLYPEFCNDGPVSGCDTFPCSNSYYKDGLPADDQGHATTCLDLVLAFGNAPLTWRKSLCLF